MQIKITASIAFTHLFARLKQSIIAALGVTFGITMFVTLMSFMTGLNQLLDGLILDRTPHIRLYNELDATEEQPLFRLNDLQEGWNIVHSVKPKPSQEKIHNSLALMQQLRQDDRIVGVAPQVKTSVFFNAGPINLNGVVQGIEVDAEMNFFSLQDYIVAGDLRDLLTINNGIILGTGLANKLLAKIGDYVQVTATNGNRYQLKVLGMYQSGLAEIDNVQSYALLSTAQKILGEADNFITDLNLKLSDVEKAPQLGQELSRLYQIDALDIQKANAQFETGTSIRNIISYAVSFALLIVAGFGIYNILNMMIYEKMDDIAILKATGFSGGDVMLIFIIQALLIGIAGGIVGLGLGYLLSYGISLTPFETEALPTVKTFPVNFEPLFYIAGIVFALVTTFFAGLMPARKAAKIDPVDIIRGK